MPGGGNSWARKQARSRARLTNWWASYEVLNGESFNNEKRMNFMLYLKLPTLTDVPVELPSPFVDRTVGEEYSAR